MAKGLKVPVQRFSREDPGFAADAVESVGRSFIGGSVDDSLLSPTTTQATDVALSQAAGSGVKRGVGAIGSGLVKGIAGIPLAIGSLAAGPLSIALGRAVRPSVSGGTVTPGGPQGTMFSAVNTYEGLLSALETEKRERRRELLMATLDLAERERGR